MAVAENVGVKVDSSDDQNLDNNTTSLAETKPSCPDDQTPKSNSSVLTNELIQRTSEVDLMSEISRLNPMAKEFVPSFLAQTHSEFLRSRLWFTNNFPVQAISTMRRSFGQGRRWINKKTNLVQNEDVIKRTVYVSDIDQQVTEEQLASLFLSCGQVVDCRICGDHKSILRFAFIEFTDAEGARSALRKSGTVFGSHPIRVHISKTAIAPVNPSFLPRSEEELEKCGKTVYCTNIDKQVTKMELENFFKTVCGEVHHLRLLGDFYHQTRIAFVEFKLAESAISALNYSGVVLGELPIRISPSKTPVRPHHSDLN
ncbi:ctc-interacting domain 13 [Arabidopsis lyrata subsp. lyrata]|uniref:Ctc-interacting domain 13 n=1 Tax=Arabidopsis lyrata subsp. lyrata TaxID=81972 RepID=D7M350_ARALL|nr:polyadenylate-binding protein-interacting protein 13 [Arabidopsis lyrata subsp. lyrata]EFH50458.1 ctc-interacting domain 13 [Arabidopsis lyrata subsp. lyrata]|eukprot:XP_002874199.1 polyadenylate-binding protein-interacting protein 13 [Arabidopsis lyrata subsp. lyrata]